ncbi:MAG: CoA transferase [Burkholderiaceae bacterium]|nr:CoA transferase [Burkholderiaceae bacterium]
MDPQPPKLPPPRLRPPGAPTALGGLRVIDFSHFIAGPYCTLMLGDFGAEVIKIESTDGGDGFRAYPPMLGDQGVPYLWVNRNKRSVALDLKSPAGQAIAMDLIATADIVVENFSTGVMARFGLDYERVKQRKPDIIYCSVSSYGRSGPYANRIGFDPVVQAESGFMALNGYPENEPVRAGPSMMDVSTALMACNGVLAAVAARERNGIGQLVEITMIETAVNMLGNFSLAYLATGISPSRYGNTQPTACPVGSFETADESIYVACANDRTYQRLVTDVLGMPELVTDARFCNSAQRRDNQIELIRLIGNELKRRPRAEWLAKMHAVGVPAGAVRTVAEAMMGPEVAALGQMSEIPHATLGTVPNVGLPIHLYGTPIVDPVGAPVMGADTDAVLRELLGYDEARVAAAAKSGGLGPQRAASED